MTNAKRVVAAYLRHSADFLMPDEINVRLIYPYMQKYNTLGDYKDEGNKWFVTISKMDDWRYSFVILLHELVEMGLTKAHGISWDDITKFDMAHPDYFDPGHHKEAPYYKEHMQALQMEKHVIDMFGLNWDDYEKACDAIDYSYKALKK